MIGLLALLFSISIAGYWLFNSQSGLQWTFSMINRLSSGEIQSEEVQGTLRNIYIANFHFSNDEFQLAMRNIHISWSPFELLLRQINIHDLSIETVFIDARASTTETPQRSLPDNLHIPFAVSIHAFQVDSIRITSAEDEHSEFIISDLTLSLQSDGRRHQLNKLDFHTPWGALNIAAKIDGNFPFDLSAHIDLTDTGPWGDTQAVVTGNLQQTNIRVNATRPTPRRDLHIQLQPFATNPVTEFHVMLEEFNPANFIASAPNANLSISADLTTGQSRKLEGNIIFKNQVYNTIDEDGLPFSAITTQAFITSEIFELQNIRVRINTDEIIHGNLSWNIHEQFGSVHLLVNKLNPKYIDSRIRVAQVSGEINLKGNAQKQSADINLKDNSVGLNASVIRSGEHIALERFNLQHNKSILTGQGELNLGNDQAFKLSGKMASFNIADFIQAPDSDLNATISLTGQLSQQISGMLKYGIQKSRLAKSQVAGTGEIAFTGFKQFKGKAELKVGTSHLLVQGNISEAGNSLQLKLNAPVLEQVGFGLAGDLQTDIILKGNFESPDFTLKLNSKQLRLPGNQHFSGLAANGRLYNDKMSFKLTINHYLTNDRTPIQQFAINADGKISEHTFTAKAQINNDIQFHLKAVGGINLKSQHWRWNGKLMELSSTGKIPVHLMAPTAVSVSSEFFSLNHTKFLISDGFVSIDQIQWTPKKWKTQGNFSNLALIPIEHRESAHSPLHFGGHWNFVSDSQLTGDLKVQRVKGDWYLPGELSSSLGLKLLKLEIKAQNRKIAGKFELISKSIGNANAYLTVPTQSLGNSWSISDESSLSGNVTANITNLKWVDSILDGEDIRTNGQLQIQGNIKGTLNQPIFEGIATGKELSILLLEHGIDLQQGELAARFHQSNLKVDHLQFISPHKAPPDMRLFKDLKLDGASGSLAITGNIGLTGDKSYLDFKISQLPITHKTDYWIIASGSGQASLYKESMRVKGNILADAGLIRQPPEDRPKLSEDIIFVNDSPEMAQQSMPLLLDMQLDLGDKFYLRVSGLEGRLTGRLNIRNDIKNTLKANGSIAAKETTFKAYGQDLTVKRGIVNFNGPLDDPRLNILAVREILSVRESMPASSPVPYSDTGGLNTLAVREGVPVVEAGVEIMGSVRHPQIRLISTPNVPDHEKLSWLVLGRKPDAGGLDTSVLLSAAGSILGGKPGGGITEQISRALGVDEISIRQSGIGSPLTGQIGVIGKRISSKAYLSYERGLMATTMGITKLTYNLTPKISILTQAGEDNAIDLFYTHQFD